VEPIHSWDTEAYLELGLSRTKWWSNED